MKTINPNLEKDDEELSVDIDYLMGYRIINTFILSDNPDLEKKEILKLKEPEYIYCLDIGGRYILSNYTEEDVFNWYTTENMKSAKQVGKSLLEVEFYLKLLKSSIDKIVSYETKPLLIIRKGFQSREILFMPDFQFYIENGVNSGVFLGEIVREEDLYGSYSSQLFNYETFIMGNYWKRFYSENNQPVLIVLAKDDIVAYRAAKLLSKRVDLKRVRFTTFERIENQFAEAGVFLKYIESKDSLIPVKTSIFKK